jgi:hypothetical protein
MEKACLSPKQAMRLVMINIVVLRVEDILARYDHDILVVLLPDMPGERQRRA